MAAASKEIDPVECVARAEPVAAKLRAIASGQPVVFEHVVEAARPLLCAAIVRAAKHRVWIVCPTVRSQESVYNELLNWVPNTLFLPEAEQPVVEGALGDPEAAAERLAVLQKLSGRERWIVVTTELGIGEAAPSRTALKAQELLLVRGRDIDRERLLAQLGRPGTRMFPRSRSAGSSPSAAASWTSIPSSTRSRCAWSFSGTNSNPSGSSIWMRRPRSKLWKAALCSSRIPGRAQRRRPAP